MAELWYDGIVRDAARGGIVMTKSLDQVAYSLTTNVPWSKHQYKPVLNLDEPETMQQFLKAVAKETLGAKLLVKDEKGDIKGPMRLVIGGLGNGAGLADVAKERREEPDAYYKVERGDASKSTATVLVTAIIDYLAASVVKTEVPVSIGVAPKNTQKALDGQDFDMQMFVSWYAHCS